MVPENSPSSEDNVPGKHVFVHFVELMNTLQDFEHTGSDWDHFEKKLKEEQSDIAHTRKGIWDLLALVDIQLSLMHVELGRHLVELQTNVLPLINEYQSLRKRCDSAYAVLQSHAPISEVCNLPNRRPHDAVMKWHSENEEFFALHRQFKAIGRSYCQYPSTLLNRTDC